MEYGDFLNFLDRLVNDVRKRRKIVIAGDFNACAIEWGSVKTNQKGQALLEAFSILDIVLLNVGDKPTFQRGDAKSRVDISFTSDVLYRKVVNWRVSDYYTNSDHQAITWTLLPSETNKVTVNPSLSTKSWKSSAFDKETLCLFL